MKAFTSLPLSEQAFYFQQTAAKTGLNAEAVEKDFWVVWVLDRLFQSDMLSQKIIFKGGTSLSKVFGLIRRFSEDIDLILDWNEVVKENPNLDRSKTQQDRFNKSVNDLSRTYISGVFLPEVQKQLGGLCTAAIEEHQPDVINICYPSSFDKKYLRPEIRLEIGPLAQWIPNARYPIRAYVAEALPGLFEDAFCEVRAIKAERTFWEKATILHHEAHRPESAPIPVRYSRHYYDLYMMSQASGLKADALGDMDLLASVVAFKQKFYPRGWARYDLAKPGTLRLIPPERILDTMRLDYGAMREMIFGRCPSWDEIVRGLRELETEINSRGVEK